MMHMLLVLSGTERWLEVLLILAHSASSQLDNFINTIEPLLSGLLMLSIGIALLSLMLPLIGIMNSIG